MRAAVTILLGSLATFLTAMIILWMFFSDVKSVASSDVAQTSVQLQTAFFLLTIEILSAFGILIASVAILTLWAHPLQAASSQIAHRGAVVTRRAWRSHCRS